MALVAQLPPEPEPPNVSKPAFHIVYKTTEVTEALALESALDAHGIQSSIEDQWSGLTAFGLPTQAVPYAVTVPAVAAAPAKEVLQDSLKLGTFKAPVDARRRALWWVAFALIVGLPVL